MITNTISAFEAPRQRSSFFLEELLGLYISGHPLDRLRDKLEGREVNINQIPYVSEDEASIWIKELENSIW